MSIVVVDGFVERLRRSGRRAMAAGLRTCIVSKLAGSPVRVFRWRGVAGYIAVGSTLAPSFPYRAIVSTSPATALAASTGMTPTLKRNIATAADTAISADQPSNGPSNPVGHST